MGTSQISRKGRILEKDDGGGGMNPLTNYVANNWSWTINDEETLILIESSNIFYSLEIS